MARAFIKWAGGKSWLLPILVEQFPAEIVGYHEPFIGGGSVAMWLLDERRPLRAVLSDVNPELIACYAAIRDEVEQVIGILQDHASNHDETWYYRVRESQGGTPAERAARTIYLNKTCFNGLYRLNKSGAFNVPFGRMLAPNIADAPTLRAASALLQRVDLRACSFVDALDAPVAGDVVYLDPPYVPLSATSSFTTYASSPFRDEDQQQLADGFRALVDRGCRVLLSNSDTPRVRQLYAGFPMLEVRALRKINRDRGSRGRINELLVVGDARA